MTRSLHISSALALPVDFVTKTAAVLAQRRKGKTYLASVIAEELVAAKLPFVALDPTGAWWGLRASADGKKAGLPVVILGGQHGDVPLERTAGKFIAELVVDQPGYYVIDFSLFESGEAERQFAVDFAERLYRAKARPKMDFPLHLFVDEADRFIPQQMRKGSGETSPRLLGAFEAIVRRGGLRGLGTTLISQRAAVVNKNVLEMLDVLFVLRTIGPNDRAAVEGYVSAHGTIDERRILMQSLASLEIGEAWVWEPGAEPPLFKRVRIRERHTFNSSATPKVGEQRAEPRQLAAIDLEAIKERMAATIEKTKADDPRELRKQIASLERDLQASRIMKPETEKVAERVVPAPERITVEVPVITDEMMTRLEVAVNAAVKSADEISDVVGDITGRIRAVTDRSLEAAAHRRASISHMGISDDTTSVMPAALHLTSASARSSKEPALPKGEHAVLTVAAQYPEGATREQVTILAGYKRSTRDAYIQRLRERGCINVDGSLIFATQTGRDVLGPDFEPLPTGRALREYWLNRLPEGEARVLRAVLDMRGACVGRDLISDMTGYKRSTRDAYIQRLKARQLISIERDGIIASAELEGR